MKKFTILLLFVTSISISCGDQGDSGYDTGLKTETLGVSSANEIKGERLNLVADRAINKVIFMIGDGTGVAQLYSGQLNEVGPGGKLHVQRFPVTGLITTYAADNLITDSAAGATAYSCGIKTNNGVIAQDENGNDCVTLLEFAQQKGMGTGIISTSGITHATPASFVSHIDSRSKYSQIAEQMVYANVDVMLGGGYEYFVPMDSTGSSREDNVDLIPVFDEQGYSVVFTHDEMMATESDKMVGLFSDGGMPSENRTPTLSEMTTKALQMLDKKENGFFLMVEGSQIDWGGHGNDTPYVLREVKDFDDAIGVAISYAENNPGTLVIVTADHETGGMTFNGANSDGSIMDIAWTTSGHTGTPIPLMAYGPHAVEFSGWWDNTEIGQKVAELFGFEDFPSIKE
jgi:alkaline phosphatase